MAPYAAATGVELHVDSWLAEGPTDVARTLVRQVAPSLGGHAEVWCSHGDVIPAVIEMLAAQDGLNLGPDPRVQKASIWILDVGADDLYAAATYIGPTC